MKKYAKKITPKKLAIRGIKSLLAGEFVLFATGFYFWWNLSRDIGLSIICLSLYSIKNSIYYINFNQSNPIAFKVKKSLLVY